MTTPSLSRQSGILLLVILTSTFYINFISRIVLSPLLPVIEKDLGLSHTGAGSFFMMIALGYSAGLLGSGFVSSRLTHRQTIVLASVSGGLAFFLIAASHSLWLIDLGLFLLGIASGFYLPSGMATITGFFPATHWGKALSVHELAPSLAFITTPLIVEVFLAFLPWQAIIALIGGAALVLGLAYHRFGLGGNFTGEAPTPGNIKLLAQKPAFWIMAVFFSLSITATVGIYSMMPLYLVAERGLDRGMANMLVGLSRIPVIAVALGSGWLADRFGPKPMIAGALMANGLTAILLGALPGRWVVLMVFLQPLLSAGFFAAGFMILSRIVPARTRNLSVAMTMLIAYPTGGGLVPIVLGSFGDAGAFGSAFIFIGCVTLLCTLLLARLDLSKQDAG